MKILIISGSDKREKAEKIEAFCQNLGSDSSIYGLSNNSQRGLSFSLKNIDLLLIIWDNNSINNPEIIFSTGYFVGLEKPFIIFSNKQNSIPHCNGKAVILSSLDQLKVYIYSEIVKIKKNENVKAAKESILEMGFKLTLRDIIEVVYEGENLVLEQFFKAEFSPDSLDKNGVSLLNIAIRKGHLSIASMLLDKGANINCISGDRGNTPLMDAAAEGNIEIMSKLIKAGALVDIKSKSGQTALVLSVGRQAEDAAILLIEAGADINIKDDLGMSARKYAELFKLEKVLLSMNIENI